MTAPTRVSVAGRAYLDLQNLGRREKRSTEELLALYALEGSLLGLLRRSGLGVWMRACHGRWLGSGVSIGTS